MRGAGRWEGEVKAVAGEVAGGRWVVAGRRRGGGGGGEGGGGEASCGGVRVRVVRW